MKDKPLNYRQSLFVKYYTDGDTKGNSYKSALKAGYTERTAQRAPEQLSRNIKIMDAIVVIEAGKERKDENTRDNVTKSMFKAAAICLNKGDMVGFIRAQENLGKNCGWFAEDNAQQQERTALDADQEAMFDDYLAYRRRMLLKPAKEA